MTSGSFADAIAAKLAWMVEAACRRHPKLRRELEGFAGGNTAPSKEALALCAGCRVRRECIRYAYDMDTSSGWFGGLAPSRRRKLGNAVAAIAYLEERGELPPEGRANGPRAPPKRPRR